MRESDQPVAWCPASAFDHPAHSNNNKSMNRRTAALRALARGDVLGGNLGVVVGAEAALAVLAVDEGIGEVRDMAGGFPYFGMHEDRGVEADDAVMELGHFPPPCFLDVVFELYAEGTVIPGACLSAVDFGGLKHETAPLAEADDFFHRYRVIFHFMDAPLPPLAAMARYGRRTGG